MTRTPTEAGPGEAEVRLRVALAIERADQSKVPDGYGDDIPHFEVSDWGVYLADAAIAALRSTPNAVDGGSDEAH
jgi:hypothetical protein